MAFRLSSKVLAHIVILLALGTRVFFLRLIPLVIDAVERVDVPLDGILGSAPHLVDEVDDQEEEQEEDTRQDGKLNHHIEEDVVFTALLTT